MGHGDEIVEAEGVDAAMRRRLAGEPLQYIRGKTEFYGREFYVDNRVLIPRPETELLVEAAIQLIPRKARVVDIGTGSGCIAVTLGIERPDLNVFAVDQSLAALAVAKRNGAQRLAASDLLGSLRRDFDAIVSNPPYIPRADIDGLMTEVRHHEPHSALTPGPLGTEILERLLIAPLVLLEIGFGQASAIREIARNLAYDVREIRNDLAGIPRVVVLSKHGE